jgi:hypothetical protein
MSELLHIPEVAEKIAELDARATLRHASIEQFGAGLKNPGVAFDDKVLKLKKILENKTVDERVAIILSNPKFWPLISTINLGTTSNPSEFTDFENSIKAAQSRLEKMGAQDPRGKNIALPYEPISATYAFSDYHRVRAHLKPTRTKLGTIGLKLYERRFVVVGMEALLTTHPHAISDGQRLIARHVLRKCDLNDNDHSVFHWRSDVWLGINVAEV